ncbi:hypothetical protein FGB62_17g08 [Gracilaria domingensis]|nr:hypothetical protein FGB62_17g08 [Gracilaria domingensis]
MHAICGRAPTNAEMEKYAPGMEPEGYGAPRICTGCNEADEIRPGRAEEAIQPPSYAHSKLRFQQKPVNIESNHKLQNEKDLEKSHTGDNKNSNSNPNTNKETHSEQYCTGNITTLDEIGSSDSEFMLDSDEDMFDSSENEGDGEQPYAWVEISVCSDNLDLEVDDLDGASTDILIDESFHILRKVSDRLGSTPESLLRKPPSAKQMFEVFFNSNVLDSFADVANLGHRHFRRFENDEEPSVYTSEDVMHYFQALMMCDVYDCSPSELLQESEHEQWYETQEIRRSISFRRFKAMRHSYTSCLGTVGEGKKGISSSQWTNLRLDIPAALNVLEQAVASISSEVCLRPGTTILGLDDDQLRFASRYHKRLPLKPGDGKKEMGLHATSLTSTLTGLTAALHNSMRGETVPEVRSALLMMSMRTSNARIAAEMIAGSIIAIDRAYATKDIIGGMSSGQIPLRFMATCKRSRNHPISCSGSTSRKRKRTLSCTGMREMRLLGTAEGLSSCNTAKYHSELLFFSP